MKLKRVKIFGFKTFADKTELEFDCDLIAVVGPNGCGKSNIVDAIMWGLGEPNARNLRANSSQEVIFSGSAKRKPLGYAEVSLLFDNSDGTLSLDCAEVEIARRLSRSGDSDYFINKKHCRQKDIFDLLADSGLGRTGYSIVGQKDIDAALSASADERRAWIDEAAGVQRFRAKRHESLRRLQSAQVNLSRVEDILHEIEVQREPLVAQVEIAKKYRLALTTLKEIEVGMLSQEFAKASELIEALEVQIASAITLIEKEQENVDSLSGESARSNDLLADLEHRFDASRELHQSLLTAQARLEGDLKLFDQKSLSLDELELSLESELESASSREKDALDALEKAREDEAVELQKRNEVLAVSGGEVSVAEFAKKLEETETLLIQARASEREKLSHEALEKTNFQRIKLIRREIAGIDETLPELESGIAEAELAAEQERAKSRELELGHSVGREVRRQSEARFKVVDAERRQILGQLASLEGRKHGIEATLESLEGVSHGARAVLMASDQGLIGGEYSLVSDAISVETDLVVAIETALGASGNDLMVSHERDAKLAIEFLKERRLGRATFQPISLMRPYFVSGEMHRLKSEKGIVGIASELVQVDHKFRPVIDSLLGRILIAESLDDALRLAKTQGWSRIVTLDGEVIHSSGAVSGGASQRQAAGMVSRKAELQALQSEIDNLFNRVQKLDKEAETIRRSLEQAEQNEEAVRTQIEALRPDRDDAERWLSNLRAELNEAQKSRARLAHELEILSGPTDKVDFALIGQIPELEARKAELIQLHAGMQKDVEQAQKDLTETESRLMEARSRRESAESRYAVLQGSSGSREEKRERIEEQRNKVNAGRKAAESEQTRSIQRLSDVAVQLAQFQTQRASLLEQGFKLAEEAKRSRAMIQTAETNLRTAEMDRARHDARKSQAHQRLLEEYGIGEAQALEIAQTSLVPDDARTVVLRLRSEIRAMGDVNVGAIDQYDQLTERFDSLNHQYQDVISSKLEIEAGIRELDELTRGRFMETFEELKVHFRDFFSLLFTGGEGELSLSSPEDTLESGVDIEVTIPGKKRQRLELLSGGERAMSACAFLFALLRCKPSPLVILDEVDAPLDGRNVERFLNALKQFQGVTQFILITHNPLTIESAPMWFGVTMQEPGVTTVVPFRASLSKEPEGRATRAFAGQ